LILLILKWLFLFSSKTCSSDSSPDDSETRCRIFREETFLVSWMRKAETRNEVFIYCVSIILQQNMYFITKLMPIPFKTLCEFITFRIVRSKRLFGFNKWLSPERRWCTARPSAPCSESRRGSWLVWTRREWWSELQAVLISDQGWWKGLPSSSGIRVDWTSPTEPRPGWLGPRDWWWSCKSAWRKTKMTKKNSLHAYLSEKLNERFWKD